MEFIHCEDRPFEAGVERAAQIGYRWFEPMVHNGRELLSEAGYFHSFWMDNDALEMKKILDRHGAKASGLSVHCPLMRPEISVPYLETAVRFASAIGAPVVDTDEGIRPDWLSDSECFQVMKYTLTRVLQTAERHGVYIGIEPHQSISKRTNGLFRIPTLVKSPFLKVNYDTGNALLGGEDPYKGLKAVFSLLIHIHAKDISLQQADKEKDKVSGTPVGCGCGEGDIDWLRVMSILAEGGYTGVLSVECGTPREAAASLKHLQAALSQIGPKTVDI